MYRFYLIFIGLLLYANIIKGENMSAYVTGVSTHSIFIKSKDFGERNRVLWLSNEQGHAGVQTDSIFPFQRKVTSIREDAIGNALKESLKDADTIELARARRHYMAYPYTVDSSGVRIPYVKNEWYFPYTKKDPSWLIYTINRDDTLLTVDVDITDCIAQDYMQKDNWIEYKETGQTDLIRSHSRYVYTRHLITGKEYGFYMTIIPSVEYARNHSNRMRFNTYLKRDSCLTGYVLFHLLGGPFVNGWEYQNGEITGKVLPPEVVADRKNKKRLLLGKRKSEYSVRLKKNANESLSSLPLEKRDSILTLISQKLIREKYPQRYRKNIKVLVKEEVFSEKGIDARQIQFTDSIWNGDIFYKVKLISKDQTDINPNTPCIGEIYITERTREPFYILLENETGHYLLKLRP